MRLPRQWPIIIEITHPKINNNKNNKNLPTKLQPSNHEPHQHISPKLPSTSSHITILFIAVKIASKGHHTTATTRPTLSPSCSNHQTPSHQCFQVLRSHATAPAIHRAEDPPLANLPLTATSWSQGLGKAAGVGKEIKSSEIFASLIDAVYDGLPDKRWPNKPFSCKNISTEQAQYI